MPDDKKPRLQIKLLCDQCKLNKLKLRSVDGALAAFLQNQSSKFHQGNVAKTYVLIDPDQAAPHRVFGYISVMVSEIKSAQAKTEEFGDNYRYEAYPAVKIGRLAIDLSLQRQDYGTDLVGYCLALIVKEIMPRIGCRFVVVDANKPAIEFYQKVGFTLVDTDANRALNEPVMFLDLQTVKLPTTQPPPDHGQIAPDRLSDGGEGKLQPVS